MHRPPKNRTVRLILVSLLRGWGLNLVVVVEVEVGTGKKFIIIIIKKFMMGIYVLELNLFGLITRVS